MVIDVISELNIFVSYTTSP